MENYIRIVTTDDLENYKSLFFDKFEKSNLSFLQYLYAEKKQVEEILTISFTNEVESVINSEDLAAEKNILSEMFGHTFYSILNEINNTVLDCKYYSESSFLEYIENIVSKKGIFPLQDCLSEEPIYKVDRLIDFLNDYAVRLWQPDLSIKNHGIAKFLDDEILKAELQTKNKSNIGEHVLNQEAPQNDYSDTAPLQRMIILEKLGIIKYIKSLQKDGLNEKHTAEILSSFTGIISGTIAKNLGVMGDKQNNEDKNSPYKNPKNFNLAQNKLDKFNIDLTKIFK